MRTQEIYDLIVVGAGPGGLVCAKFAAEYKLRTLVLEKSKQIGDKNASGCALSPKCWRDLPFMNTFFDQVPHRVGKRATMHFINQDREETSTVSFSASKRFASYDGASSFLTINAYRKDFDVWLAGLASATGAIIKNSSLVTDVNFNVERVEEHNKSLHEVVVNGTEKYYAPLVIAADGVFSQVMRSAGLHSKWRNDDLTLMVTIDFEAEKDKIDEFFGNNSIHYFYGANFPIGYVFFNQDGFHAGLGHYINWFIKEKVTPLMCLEELLSTPAIQKIVKLLGAKPREFQAHALPFLASPNQQYTDGMLALGDANGLICPLEAEGVYYAMMAGKIAADVALEAKRNNDYSSRYLSNYQGLIEVSPIGQEFQLGREWKQFIDNVPFNLDASPWINELLNDTLFAAMNVAESHAETIQQHMHQRALLLGRIVYPHVKDIVSKPMVSILDEFLNHYLEKLNLSALLRPLLNSTRSMRERIIKQVLDDWLVDKRVLEMAEEEIPPLKTRILATGTLNVRNLINIDESSEPIILYDDEKCVNCGNCEIICPMKLWKIGEKRAILEEGHQKYCVECGSCFQACNADAITIQFPMHGKGVRYTYG